MMFRKEDWLCNIPGIGIQKIKSLLECFDSVEAIYDATDYELKQVKGIGDKEIACMNEYKKGDYWSEIKKKCDKYQVQVQTFLDQDYPNSLRELFQPPKNIYWKGEMPQAEKINIAIIGARNCSHYGKEMAKWFSYTLARQNMQIISGMARGIDGWAHQGALEAGGKTYAILGNSPEICYPREHCRLYQSILKQGGVLSEYPPETKANPSFFPMRNRIISALSKGILVVEAREKSGSLITVQWALESGKDVFVVPGRIGDELSEGCNNLIKMGAYLVTKPEEILDFYGISTYNIEENLENFNIFLETEEKMVYSILSLEPKSVHVMMNELNLDEVTILKCIFKLQKYHLIQEIGNQYYIKVC